MKQKHLLFTVTIYKQNQKYIFTITEIIYKNKYSQNNHTNAL